MFVRIVKLSFHPDKIDLFIKNFDKHKEDIRNFSGCRLLELYRDKNTTNIFFTYSYWESEKDLINYKNSKLFDSIWKKTKVLFNDKPEAWSVDRLRILK